MWDPVLIFAIVPITAALIIGIIELVNKNYITGGVIISTPFVLLLLYFGYPDFFN